MPGRVLRVAQVTEGTWLRGCSDCDRRARHRCHDGDFQCRKQRDHQALPYPDSDALVSVAHTVDGRHEAFFGDAIYTLDTEQNRTFEAFGVWTPYLTAATVTGRGDPEEVRALALSHGLLAALAVHPEVGRGFSAEDDAPGSPDTVMLTHSYWLRAFGSDPGVVSRILTVNSQPHQIIGVMPREFRFGGAPVNTSLPMSPSDIILPLRINRAAPLPVWRHLGVARLKPGVTAAQANADITRMVAIWSAPSELPAEFRDTRYGASLRVLKQDIVGNVSRTLWVVMAAIGIVLLMACANVATMLLMRADVRRREFAIRVALGAPWTRVARALLVESMTLAYLSGFLGIGIAYASLWVLVAIGPSDLPRLSEISIDTTVLGFAVLVSMVSGLVFGSIPILSSAEPRLATAIAGGDRTASLTKERHRSQYMLVALQIAMAMVLLLSSGLMIRSFRALRQVDPGFARPEGVQTFSVSIPVSEAAEPERVTRMQHEILNRIAAIPGVESVAFTSRLPMDTSGRTSSPVFAEGKDDDTGNPTSRQIRFVSPGMFRTLGTPLVAGNDVTWIDIFERRDVAILSANLAQQMWGSTAAAVGKRIREANGGWRDVVGVTGNIYDDGVHRSPTPMLFLPARWHAKTLGLSNYLPRRVTFVVRSERSGTEGLLRQVRQAVWTVNEKLPLAQLRTLGAVYSESMARTSFTLVMVSIAAGIALLLGLFGVYGVIAYAMSQRRREIGIRLALGARLPQIRGLFMRQALVVVGVGIGIGLAGAAGFMHLMDSLLFGISPLDPITFGAMPIVLATTALLASHLSTRRAMMGDPVEALRAE